MIFIITIYPRPLTKKYQEVTKKIYLSSQASSGMNRRKQHADSQEKFSNLLNHIILYEKGAKHFPGKFSSNIPENIHSCL